MIIPEGEWSGGQDNILIGITPQPPNSWIIYAAILPDEPGRYQTTPYSFISTDLCNITPFIQLITTAQATCHGYLRDIHHRNNLHLQFQVKYFLAPIYRANINDALIASLDTYIAKVIYVNVVPDQALHNYLIRLHVPAIVIYPRRQDADHARTLGLDALASDEALPVVLNDKIANRFCLTPAQLDQLGFTGDRTPNNTITTKSDLYEFGESVLTPYPTTNLRPLLPNERLVNDLRKRYPPLPITIENEERLPHLIDLSEAISTQKLLDYWIAAPQGTPTDIPVDLRELVATYKASRTAVDYDALFQAAKARIREFSGPHDPILCSPALNKANIDDHLKTFLPSRVRKYLYKAKADNYLTLIERALVEHPEHRVQLQAALAIQELENEYLSSLLTLYALTTRRPVLRTPQFPSSLFHQLATLRRTAPEREKLSFVNGIDAVCNALNEQLPGSVRKYLETTRTDHIKLISDLPMEWAALNGVPLVYQQDLSRLPITPGNVLFTHYANVGSTLLLDAKPKVLIANAMRPSDALHRHPSVLVEQARRLSLNVTYVEPATVKDYWAVLMKEQPLILVHWGHGSYIKADNQGYLHIRDEKTPVWGTNGVAIPSIVILGACETAAMAESHNTPAIAWLGLGARTVLATYFPVDAAPTLVVLARILANFCEAFEKNTSCSTWSEVVSKTLGLNRYLDFVEGFNRWCDKKRLPHAPTEFGMEYTYRYNKARLSAQAGYHACKQVMQDAMRHFGNQCANAFEYYLKHIPTIPHTMFFTQFGSPETIKIIKTKDADTQNNKAHEYWQERAAQDASA
jgi:hypothetical protein